MTTKVISLQLGRNTGVIMNYDITAVIPTRKGSERIKSKNTRPFAEKSLLEYKILTLLQLKKSNVISDIVVNSDCDESKKISESYGVRFVERESGLADSDAPITSYWRDVLMNTNTEHSMLCQCTSPLITYDTYVDAIQNYNGKSLIGVDRIKDYIWRNDKPLNYDWPNHPKSQDLPDDIFKLNFGICIMSVKDMKEHRNLVIPSTKFIYLDEIESIDIDTELDFMVAEKIYEIEGR